MAVHISRAGLVRFLPVVGEEFRTVILLLLCGGSDHNAAIIMTVIIRSALIMTTKHQNAEITLLVYSLFRYWCVVSCCALVVVLCILVRISCLWKSVVLCMSSSIFRSSSIQQILLLFRNIIMTMVR